jgi:hypothetical protein
MADYSTSVRGLIHNAGLESRELSATSATSTITGNGAWVRRPWTGVLYRDAYRFVLNRGTNSGAGAAFVYWLSPNNSDPSGVYYNQAVPWGQITSVIEVTTVYPGRAW